MIYMRGGCEGEGTVLRGKKRFKKGKRMHEEVIKKGILGK